VNDQPQPDLDLPEDKASFPTFAAALRAAKASAIATGATRYAIKWQSGMSSVDYRRPLYPHVMRTLLVIPVDPA
jgi:hypothetical protein